MGLDSLQQSLVYDSAQNLSSSVGAAYDSKITFRSRRFGLFVRKGGKLEMKTVNEILGENQTLRGAVRVLTGKTNSGKRAIYISGNPAGLRLLADIMRAQADAVGSGGGESRYFFKLERQSGSLFFATDDSVDIFEIHCDDHYPEKHETPSVRKD